jgi:hypothetical protein
MNSNTINEYILKLEKENAESRLKIEQLKKLFEETDRARVAALEKLNAKPSLYETTARTKVHIVNEDIANHLRELGDMTSDFYKTAAYRRAADIIFGLDFEVKNGESLLKINGIGKSIAARIDDFLDEYYNYVDDSESVASNEGQIIDDDSDSDSDFFVSYNDDLVDIFDKLASFEEDPHKRDAYRTVSDALHTLPFKVTNGKELAKGPKKVKGIGKTAARIIDEFLETGKVKKLEKATSTSTNEEIAWALEALASLEAEPHGSQDPFKIRAYRRAAEIIRELEFEVTSGAEIAKGPKKIEGIGAGIGKKIDEFLQTGKMKRIEELTR